MIPLKESILRKVPHPGSSPEEPISWRYEDSGQRIVKQVDPASVRSITPTAMADVVQLTFDGGGKVFIEGTVASVEGQLGICTEQEEEEDK